MTDFLQWLADNQWYKYKDGTWYTTNERPYIHGKTRRYYTNEELIKLYDNSYLCN